MPVTLGVLAQLPRAVGILPRDELSVLHHIALAEHLGVHLGAKPLQDLHRIVRHVASDVEERHVLRELLCGHADRKFFQDVAAGRMGFDHKEWQ